MIRKLFLLFIVSLVSICHANNNLQQHTTTSIGKNTSEARVRVGLLNLRYGQETDVPVDVWNINRALVMLHGAQAAGPAVMVLINRSPFPVIVNRLNIPKGVIVKTIGYKIYLNEVPLCSDDLVIEWRKPPPPPPPAPATAIPVSIGASLVLDNVVLQLVMANAQQNSPANMLKDTDMPEVVCDGACVWQNVTIKYPNGTIIKCDPNVVGYCKPL